MKICSFVRRGKGSVIGRKERKGPFLSSIPPSPLISSALLLATDSVGGERKRNEEDFVSDFSLRDAAHVLVRPRHVDKDECLGVQTQAFPIKTIHHGECGRYAPFRMSEKRRGSLPPVAQRGSSSPLLPTGNKTATWRKILSCFPPPPPPTTAIFAAHLRKKKRDPCSFPPRERLYQYGQRSFVWPTTSPFPLIPRFRVPSPDLGGRSGGGGFLKRTFPVGVGAKKTYIGRNRSLPSTTAQVCQIQSR